MTAPGTDRILFNHAVPVGDELAYVTEAVQSGLSSASGPFCERAAALLQEETGAREVMLTTSCTAALELSAMLLDFRPGDCVIVPSYTFTSSAMAFVREGARILYADIEPETLGIDPAEVARLLEEAPRHGLRVRAVVAVHYGGVPCRLDDLAEVLADHPGVALVEDNAHGLFGRHRGRPLGSFGRFATQSFHATKNFSCGEGGALLVNADRDVDRARVLYDKGTNRQAFLLGQVDKYSWVDTGSSFGLSDVLAAHLAAQLEAAEEIQQGRRAVWEAYAAGLADGAGEYDYELPVVPPTAEPAWHLFHVLLPDRRTRDAVLRRLNDRGVRAVFHYVPLHSSVAGRRFSALDADCPVSEDVSARLLRLPLHLALTDSQVDRVITEFRAAVAAISRVRAAS